jgi:Bacterial regulatory proteins, luxR family
MAGSSGGARHRPPPGEPCFCDQWLTARTRRAGCGAALPSAATAEGRNLSSVATVKTHVSRLLDKLGCRDRAQLVVVAYETGVAIPGRQLR